jgi:hypothetical protein
MNIRTFELGIGFSMIVVVIPLDNQFHHICIILEISCKKKKKKHIESQFLIS